MKKAKTSTKSESKAVKCHVLECTLDNTKLGKEFGELVLNKHDLLLVRDNMAGRVETQYNPRFKRVGSEEKELSKGWYEVKVNPAKSAGKTELGKPADKSMGTQSGAPKK